MVWLVCFGRQSVLCSGCCCFVFCGVVGVLLVFVGLLLFKDVFVNYCLFLLVLVVGVVVLMLVVCQKELFLVDVLVVGIVILFEIVDQFVVWVNVEYKVMYLEMILV